MKKGRGQLRCAVVCLRSRGVCVCVAHDVLCNIYCVACGVRVRGVRLVSCHVTSLHTAIDGPNQRAQ